jgi:murein L,D-transpeptidase YafK
MQRPTPGVWLIGLLVSSFVLSAFASAPKRRPARPVATDFKSAQLKFPHVREAYAEKSAAVNALFKAQGLPFPAASIFLRIFKADGQVELWAQAGAAAPYRLVKSYSVCAASGQLGPKRREGDLQVPEGYYFLRNFNPLSSFYLSMEVDYPNASDRILSDRKRPGGLIYIHGNCVTIGCVPITDDGIKELYLVAVEARTGGQQKIPVHIFPTRLDAAGLERLAVLAKDYPDKEKLLEFWRNLQPGYEYFEKNHRLPKVTVDGKGRYVIAAP